MHYILVYVRVYMEDIYIVFQDSPWLYELMYDACGIIRFESSQETLRCFSTVDSYVY
jgi:hypothetical protein